MALSWRLLLYLLLAVLVDAQTGFISIDCGIPAGGNYTDEETGIVYSSDAGFILTGENKAVIGVSSAASIKRQYRNMRTFPTGERNCYTLQPVKSGRKYFLRASFLNGVGEGTQAPQFDLYVGVNLWSRVNLPNASAPWWTEMVTIATMNFIPVCLVNTGTGTPFISALELRPVKDTMYEKASTNQSLVAMYIYNAGATTMNIVRYPDDVYDRLWQPYTDLSWASLNTNLPIQNIYLGFEPPSTVMQTAGTPLNANQTMFFNWTTDDPNKGFHIYRHFADFQENGNRSIREISCCNNGQSCFAEEPPYLATDTVYTKFPETNALQYSVSFAKTTRSTLPPILNAFEIYAVQTLDQPTTNIPDVYAITSLKEAYGVEKNWMGDPCLPSKYLWDGLTCSYETDGSARITSLDLSSSGLTGTIDASIGNLNSIRYLDLSRNNLTGTIPQFLELMSSLISLDLSNNNLNGVVPQFLSTLSQLTYLNLSGNHFSGSIPLTLVNKAKSGSLTLSVDPNLCTWDTCNVVDPCASKSCKKSRGFIVPLVIAASILAVAIFIIGLILWMRQRKQKGANSNANHFGRGESFNLDNRRFSYSEIVSITNNFQRVLGRGGFGTVYYGQLKDGTEVAVKVLLQHCQASLEFQTEAQLLMTLHHRNLVRFVGYCVEGNDNKALILEYMSKGNLGRLLSDSDKMGETLSWNQRIRIALSVAQGLEYLHVGCKPPIIHRDVKAANILLNENLEAKIADFGICKVFSDEQYSHISTQVKGTHGYLDPEYYIFNTLNEKSDVYGYGVVLMELITGQQAIIKISESQRISLVEWVAPLVSSGDIKAIVDPKLEGNYDVTSAWKVMETAISCTQPRSAQRPAISNVVSELKDCLEAERAIESSFNQASEEWYTRTADDSIFLPMAR